MNYLITIHCTEPITLFHFHIINQQSALNVDTGYFVGITYVCNINKIEKSQVWYK